MSAIKEIEQAVLGLPVKQRVALTERLLDSLPPLGDTESESEELAEVERRESEIESGQVQPLTDPAFWKRVQARSGR
jgi:putative addiction module component (TIGR02574 family)